MHWPKKEIHVTKNKIRYFTIDFFLTFFTAHSCIEVSLAHLGKGVDLKKCSIFRACAVAHLARSRQLTAVNLRSWSSCWGRWSRERVKLEFQITLFFVCSFLQPFHSLTKVTELHSNCRNSKFYLGSCARALIFSILIFQVSWRKMEKRAVNKFYWKNLHGYTRSKPFLVNEQREKTI